MTFTAMHLRYAERRQARIRVLLQGPSGSGKTYSSLLLAYGLTGNWSSIAIIDTENKSADLFEHLGKYRVLVLEPPYTPERYIEALKVCEGAGVQVIILDSLSHEWQYILDEHSAITGNSYTNWSKLTPRHDSLVNALLQSNCHLIATVRAKQDYVLVEKNNRQVPEKVGMKGITREGMDYEFTLVFELDNRHYVRATKDRTGLFTDKPDFSISPNTGQQILRWCQEGTSQQQVEAMIKTAKDTTRLKDLYDLYPEFREALTPLFTERKNELQLISLPKHPKSYGNSNHAA